MLTVTNLAGQEEALNNIQGFEMDEEVNGAFTVKFTSFSVENNPGHELIEEESLVSVDGYDFRVKQLRSNRNRKVVTAISTFYDHVGTRQESIFGGTHTFNEFATFVFQGTGWTFSSDVTGSRFIPNFGDENVVVLKEALCSVFECEMKIMPNNHVHFATQIGPDNDAQYRYGHNVKALSKNVDANNLRMKITGYGGNGLVVTYTSPNANKFPHAGSADPIRDERYTQPDSLLEHLKRNLNDYPEASFELDTVELTNKELGERVWLIYEPMGIEFQTRILSKKSIIRGNKLVPQSVVLGNTMPKTLSDILTKQKIEINENAKEYRSRIEQTNDRITLEVEAVNSSIAAVNIRADNITLSVTQLDGRMGNAESSISLQAGQIQSRVTYAEYNGPTVTSLITQDAWSISQMAQYLNLQGLVTFTNLSTPGSSVIDGGNIYANLFRVGNMAGGTALDIYAVAGSHRIRSFDAAGMRIWSSSNLSLQADGGTVYALNKLWAQNNFQVTGFSEVQDLTSTGNIRANSMDINFQTVATQMWVLQVLEGYVKK